MAEYFYTSVANVKMNMRKLPTSITDEEILYHIKKADAVINAKLSGAFEVPFAQVPPLVETISTDLAIFFLAESLYSSNMPNLDEYQQKRYDRAMDWLEEIIHSERDRKGSDFATTNTNQVFTFEDPEW
jgi:phage gp36-like protein